MQVYCRPRCTGGLRFLICCTHLAPNKNVRTHILVRWGENRAGSLRNSLTTPARSRYIKEDLSRPRSLFCLLISRKTKRTRCPYTLHISKDNRCAGGSSMPPLRARKTTLTPEKLTFIYFSYPANREDGVCPLRSYCPRNRCSEPWLTDILPGRKSSILLIPTLSFQT